MNGEILLGGTARNPEDVLLLADMGLRCAEIAITRPDRFRDVLPRYATLRERLEFTYLCHGPREGDPNDTESLENRYLPRLEGVLDIMPLLGMRTLTVHLQGIFL